MIKFAKKNKYILVLCVLSFVMLFVSLGKTPLLDPDEPVYAETAKEMHLSGDFLSPRIYGEYWYDKPPMYYWFVAMSQFVFGENEFAARFPSACMAFASILLMFFAIRKLLDEKTAFLSALVLLTSIEFFYLAKGAVTDTTLTFFLMMSLFGFLLKKYYVWYIGAALAVVTKGPIGIFFPVLIAILFLVFDREKQEWRNIKLFKGTILFLLVASPWYILMYLKHGFVFLDTFLGFHNITRFTSAEHPETNRLFFYFFVLVVGFFPWVILLPQSLFLACKNKLPASNLENIFKRKNRQVLVFCLIWAVSVFIFFTAAQTKLVSYILPMFPPLAVLVGYYLNNLTLNYSRMHYNLWGLLLLTVVIIINVSFYFSIDSQDKMFCNYYYITILFDLMYILFIISVWRKKFFYAIYAKVLIMCVVAVFLNTTFLQPVIGDFSIKKVADEFPTIYDGKSDIYVMKFLRPGFAYYTGKYGIEILNSNSLSNISERSGPFYIVMTETDLKKSKGNFNESQFIRKIESDNKIVFYKKF